MPRLGIASLLLSLLALGVAGSCKSRWRPEGMDAGGSRPDSGGVVDATHDVADVGNRLSPCLDNPNDLPRPPSGSLPCELIPPGLQL